MTKDNILPPHDIDAEEAVLGSILISPDIIGEVSLTLMPVDFAAFATDRPSCRKYAAMSHLSHECGISHNLPFSTVTAVSGRIPIPVSSAGRYRTGTRAPGRSRPQVLRASLLPLG